MAPNLRKRRRSLVAFVPLSTWNFLVHTFINLKIEDVKIYIFRLQNQAPIDTVRAHGMTHPAIINQSLNESSKSRASLSL